MNIAEPVMTAYDVIETIMIIGYDGDIHFPSDIDRYVSFQLHDTGWNKEPNSTTPWQIGNFSNSCVWLLSLPPCFTAQTNAFQGVPFPRSGIFFIDIC
jgi:hypothetical protein